MDDHQRAMWVRMLDRLDAFEHSQVDLTTLVRDLRGLLVEADPHDASIREGFEVRWSELNLNDELRTERWAPAGSFDEDRLKSGIAAFRDWITGSVVPDSTTEHS